MFSVDYLKSGVSYAIAGTANLPTILPQLAPYLLILSSFLAFVFWNGGVVLGTYPLFRPHHLS